MKQLPILAFVALAMAACGSPEQSDQTSAAAEPARTTETECVAKGDAYFQEIESWPNLSDGRDAHKVAIERCGRTTGAFDGLQ